ncbi:MAG: hypothetical protein JWO58_609 [Chitinophagaceae bacterium]|nr:hypothetical protein [Chitinophagaceae bacterium]
MKTKLLSFIAFAFVSWTAAAQNAIPNGDFETWNSATFETPQNYPYSSNDNTIGSSLPFNCVKTTDSYHGTYAVQLTTEIANGDTIFGYFVNTNPDNGNPTSWHGGSPYTQQPTGIKGYYKSSIAAGDTALIIVAFSKAGTNIGTHLYKLYGTHSTYTPFSFPLNPALSQTPDSVVFAAISSDILINQALDGSMLQIDSVSFTGVASQPALFNGDFETWQSTTIKNPANWYLQNGQPTGVTQTTDVEQGTYAIELKTFLGNRNGQPTAQAASIGTGYYPNNCNGICSELGGYPFISQKDTLVFSYKYVPSGIDSALVYLNFKLNGTSISGFSKNLPASASYQTVQMPFDIGQTPDSVMVQFQSSLWQDSSVAYVGSDLKLDNIYFKSQAVVVTAVVGPTTDNGVSLYPNPSHGVFVVTTNVSTATLEITNALGQKIYSQNMNSNYAEINLSSQPKGIYQYLIQSDAKTISRGKFIIE